MEYRIQESSLTNLADAVRSTTGGTEKLTIDEMVASITSVFNGKTAAFYGDSITEENFHYVKGYHKWVQEILGLSSYENRGVSGYTIQNVYERINAIDEEEVDIIFVMCGVNDLSPLGQFGDTELGTTYGAMDKLCSALKEKYPTAIHVVITPAFQNKYTNEYGTTCYEISKAWHEVCDKYAIPIFDSNTVSGIYYSNLEDYTTDNCHWNDLAHEIVGKNLAKFMLSTFNYISDNDTQDFDVTIDDFDFGTASLISFTVENPGIKEGLSATISFKFDTDDGFTPETSTTDGPFGSAVIEPSIYPTLPYCNSNIIPSVSGNKVTNRAIIGDFIESGDLAMLDSNYLTLTVSMNGAGVTLPKTVRLTDCKFTVSGKPQKIINISSYKGFASGVEVD